MKINFVNPPVWPGTRPVDRVYGCTYALYPIPNIFALTYAAILEKEGHDVSFIDAPNEKITAEDFTVLLKKEKADVFSFHSVNLSQNIDQRCHRVIREHLPHAWIIYTGPAPTDRPDAFLIDERTIVARGEPDLILNEIIKGIESTDVLAKLKEVKGISYRNSEKHIHNNTAGEIENLDALPFPARHLSNPRFYHNPKLPKEPLTAAITSRNCAFQCIFCVPNSLGFARELEHKRFRNNSVSPEGKMPEGYGKFIKPAVRKRSAENVVEEMRLIKSQGYKSVSFVDDQFLWEEERTIKICEGMKPLNLQWGCLARADRVTVASAKAMAESGCRYVDFGIESMNPATLKYVQKNATVEQMRRGVKMLQDAKIKLKVNMLIGANPNETKEEIWQSIREVISMKPEVIMFSIVSPFPGTKYYEIAKKEGYFAEGEYVPESVQHKAITNYANLSRGDLDKLIWQANAAFYFRPDVIARNLWRLGNPRSAYSALMALKEKMIR